MKNYISIFVLSFILVSSNISYAQDGNSMPQNLINAPGVFNFNTANSITGNQTRREYDSDGDGTADRIYTYTYDANGNQTRREYDSDGDGTADRIYTYTYDANGNQTRREYDSNGDGTADLIYTYTYDANGNRTGEEYDSDGDGTADEIYTYTYDAKGNITREEYDYGGDGTADRISKYTYDAKGNITREEYDYGGDGTADRISKYTYDAKGNRTRVEYDSDGDGTADRIYTSTYDANGNQTREEYDSDGDGTADEIYTYTYDANGNRTREERDSDADGAADEITTYTYDANGNQTREERDSDADGAADEITTYTYDANGNQTREEREENGVTKSIYKRSFSNTTLCPNLAKGLVHKLEVVVPESGVWRFSLCGSDFQNVLALSSTEYCDSNLFYANNGCFNDDATADVRLELAGTYYLTVAGRWNKDNGNYNLEITRLQGLDVPSIEKEMVTVYPNPAENQITVNSSMKIDSYQIFNALGEKVLGGVLTNPTIQIESLHSGSYFIVLDDKNGNQTYRKKFIK
jgi:YD repeat-containing protein